MYRFAMLAVLLLTVSLCGCSGGSSDAEPEEGAATAGFDDVKTPPAVAFDYAPITLGQSPLRSRPYSSSGQDVVIQRTVR